MSLEPGFPSEIELPGGKGRVTSVKDEVISLLLNCRRGKFVYHIDGNFNLYTSKSQITQGPQKDRNWLVSLPVSK